MTVSVPPSEVQGPLVVLAAALWQSWGTGSASGLQLGSGSGPFPEPEPVGCVSVFLGLGCLPRERLENFLGPGRDLMPPPRLSPARLWGAAPPSAERQSAACSSHVTSQIPTSWTSEAWRPARPSRTLFHLILPSTHEVTGKWSLRRREGLGRTGSVRKRHTEPGHAAPGAVARPPASPFPQAASAVSCPSPAAHHRDARSVS